MIQFEPFEEADIPRLISWIGSEAELVQWTGHHFKTPLTEEQLRNHLHQAQKQPPPCYIFKVRLHNSGEIIGHIELDRIDYQARTAKVCRVLVGPKRLRGSGLGSMMMEKLLHFAFTELELQQVGLNVVIFNQAAISIYRKMGFETAEVREGSLRIGEKSWTSYYMTLDRTTFLERFSLDRRS